MSTAKNKSVIVHRKAEQKDYEAVLNIDRNIYNGDDYLPHLYFDYLRDENKWNTIVEVDGKVVAFQCFSFVDDGQAVIIKSGRVCPKFRGQGLLEMSAKYWSQYMNDLKLRIQWHYLTTVDKPAALKKVRNNPKTHHIAVTRLLLTSVFENDQLYNAMEKLNHAKISETEATDQIVTTRVPYESALQILDQEIRFQDFTPEGFWVVSCMEPYKSMKSNNKLIMKDTEMLVSRLPSRDGDKIIGLSFCHVVPCKAGLRHRLDFYPHVDYCHNTGLLVKHVWKRLQYLQDKYGHHKVFTFSIILPEAYSNNVLSECFRQLGLGELRQEPSLCIAGKGLPFNLKSAL